MSTSINLGYWNVNGLNRDTLRIIDSLTSTHHTHIWFLAETWFTHTHSDLQKNLIPLRSNLKYITDSSPTSQRTNMRQKDGLLLLTSDDVYERIQSGLMEITRGKYFIHLADSERDWGCCALYLPPSLPPDECLRELARIPDACRKGPEKILVGDWNARMGALSDDSKVWPYDRATALEAWTRKTGTLWCPNSNGAPKRDRVQHLFASPGIRISKLQELTPTLSTTPHRRPASDHPALIWTTEFPPERFPCSEASLPNQTERPALKFLQNRARANLLRTTCYELLTCNLPNPTETARALCQDIGTFGTRGLAAAQQVIDSLNDWISSIVVETPKAILGSYTVHDHKVRTRHQEPWSRRIHRAHHATAAIKAFKQAMRHSGADNRIESRSPDREPADDVLHFYQEVFGLKEGMTRPHPRHSNQASENSEFINLCAGGNFTFVEFTESEIVDFLKHYPSTKGAGPDGVLTPIVKCLATDGGLGRAWSCLFSICASTGITPSDWNETHVMLIPKNEHHTVADKRPISMTQIGRRCFEAILLRKTRAPSYIPPVLSSTLDLLHPSQTGFRRGQSTIAHALLLHELLVQNAVAPLFVDFKQAYDRVDLELLMDKLRTRGEGLFMRRLLRNLYIHTAARFCVNGRTTARLEKDVGLLQGGLFSPALFACFFDDLEETTANLLYKHVPPWLKFADDAVGLVARHRAPPRLLRQSLVERWRDIEAWSDANHMSINAKKSAELIILPTDSPPLVTWSGTPLPRTSEYKYLGFPTTKCGLDLHSLLSNNLAKSRAVWLRCKYIGRFWPPWLKTRIYTAFIRSRLEYGAPLLHAALRKNLIPGLATCWAAALEFEKEVIQWIFNWSSAPLPILWRLIDIPPLEIRFTQLHASFQRHWANIAHPRWILGSLTDKLSRTNCLIPRSLLGPLKHSPLHHSYLCGVELLRKGRTWSIGGTNLDWTWRLGPSPDGHMIPQREPPCFKTFLRLSWINSRPPHIMESLLPKRKGMDISVSAPDPLVRAILIRWRTNRWLINAQCDQNHSRTRLCISRHPPPSLQAAIPNTQWASYQRDRPGMPHPSSFTIIDHLLNQRLPLLALRPLIWLKVNVWYAMVEEALRAVDLRR